MSDVVAEIGGVRRPELPVLVVLDPRLAQDMQLPPPNSDLKHLVSFPKIRSTRFAR